MKVGILYICTGKYNIFWKDFYLSSEKFLLNDVDENGQKIFEKNYFVWTDAQSVYGEEENSKIRKICQKDLGWPGNTLMRFDVFLSQKKELEKMDFIFFFNANSLILENISEVEFLPNENLGKYLVATLHPGFFNKDRSKFTYDENPNSLAFINKNEGERYFAGGLNGGATKDFLEACETMDKNTKIDLEKNIIAKFHDESHWNKYLIDRKDIKILGPEYLYPQNWNLKLDKPIKMIIRDKEKYLKTNLFSLKQGKQNLIRKVFLILKKKIGDNLKKIGFKKY